ncbi:MAG: ACP S-malonyltransferase [Cytophagales bacterium]|nr:ACP S-malonyltransferase [Cytophagales bacterium]
MRAYLFPGQGAQFPGMGKELYDRSTKAKILFEAANKLLGFRITDIMFEGSQEALQQTKITQPAIFLYAVILAETTPNFKPDRVAGHSLGEFSALVANKVLSFEDGLKLVTERAWAMQEACERVPGTMAAVVGLEDKTVEQLCDSIDEVVVPANYNCPGQLVISGSMKGVELACEAMKKAGAKRVIPLQVGGAFHSPLMEPARYRLAKAITHTKFYQGICPIYQNVDALPSTDLEVIKDNLMMQLTSPVRWTPTILNMMQDGTTHFIACGPGKVLQGLVKKIDTAAHITAV